MTKRTMLLLSLMPLVADHGGGKSKGMAGRIGHGKLVSSLFAVTIRAYLEVLSRPRNPSLRSGEMAWGSPVHLI